MSERRAWDRVWIQPPIPCFTAEGIDHAVRALAPLMRPRDRHLLDPQVLQEHVGVLKDVDALRWDDPKAAVEAATKILTRETVSGAVLDPAADSADIPWCQMLGRLAGLPLLGSKAARRWFAHLYRLQVEDAPVSALAEAVAAYAVAAFEVPLGRVHEATRWLETASIVAKLDDRPMLELIAIVRAARLLEPVLLKRPT